MFNLDPGKLLVIAVVAIILLGPDRLPQVARQVGAAWRSFNEFRHRLESEVRTSMPDLPPTSEIARLARSPSALLNHLSTLSPDEEEQPDGSYQPAPSANGKAHADTSGSDGGPEAPAHSDDPNAGDPMTPASNGAGKPETLADRPIGPAPTSPQRTPLAASPPEAIVPGDPTLN